MRTSIYWGIFLSWSLISMADQPQVELEKINRKIKYLKNELARDKHQLGFLHKDLKKRHNSLKILEKKLQEQKLLLEKKQQQLQFRQQKIQLSKKDYVNHKLNLKHWLTDGYLRNSYSSNWLLPKLSYARQRNRCWQRSLFLHQNKIITQKIDYLVNHQFKAEQLTWEQKKVAREFNNSRIVHQKLEHQKSAQSINLTLLEQQLAFKSKNLNKLIVEKQNLERLIKDLIKIDKTASNRPPFTGKWPCKGEIVVKFGSRIQNSDWYNNNLLLRTVDSSFRAISGGKVIYAGPFKGYGLLLILEHSKDYLSIYGNNQHLYKRVGDLVEEGEVVGEITPIKQGEYELYFAVKWRGQAIDPQSLTWINS